MALYAYKAVDQEGQIVEGMREATDSDSVVAFLQQTGWMPIRVAPVGANLLTWLRLGRTQKDKPDAKAIALFTRELATLLSAGIPIDRSLAILSNMAGKDSLLGALSGKVLEKVKSGAQLSQALEAQEGVFSRFYLNLIRAGEAGGALENTLERLSEYLERSKELRDTVVTALIYPLLLVIMALASLFVLLAFVVPQFQEMFESAGKTLPLPTRVVIAIAEGVRDYGWLGALLVIAAVGYFRWQMADPARRYAWDRRLLNLPRVGELIRLIEVANLSRTLATLLSNGVALLSALVIVRETLSNRVMVEAIGKAEESLREGGGMSSALIDTGVFPEMALHMVKLGEESGRLGEMLDRVASTYDKEVRVTVQRLLALLEPVLIVGLGIMIAGIIVSILLAILSVNDLAF